MARAYLLLVLLALIAAACTKRNPAACCTTAADCEMQGLPEGSRCDDGLACVNNNCVTPASCQADSDCEGSTPSCDTASNTCVECTTSDDCGDGVCDTVVHTCEPCGDDGQCATGYCDLSTGLCSDGVLTPKYFPDGCDGDAVTALSVAEDLTIDTTEVTRCNGGVVPQTGAPGICVIRFTTIDVAAKLRFRGTRPVALIADNDVLISGTVDASGSDGISGPGGGTVSSGAFDGTATGGGGAGFRTPGAPGGGSTTNGGGALSVSSTILVGGPSAGVAYGAGGGGAIAVVSCRGKIELTGALLAGGGGGTSGTTYGMVWGGRGGGAGGQIVLEARAIEIGGVIAANGGGGGGGSPCLAIQGTNGQSGNSLACAGVPFVGGGGAGGAGGCQQNLPMPGSNTQTCTSGGTATAGGGGGSMGYVRTAMPLGRMPVLSSTMISPALEPNETIETH